MSVLGLALLAAVALLVPATGLPAFAVLLLAAVVGAVAGVADGVIPAALLAALPASTRRRSSIRCPALRG